MDNTVYLIDDDMSVRDALSLLLGLEGYRTAVFADAVSFLDAWRPEWRGCLLIDIRMPGMDGLALQKQLLERGCDIPVAIITGHGDVASARQAFRAEAVDFIEKPIDKSRLMQAVNEAFVQQDSKRSLLDTKQRQAVQLEELTPREYEVMELVVAGRHNRDIAEQLGISVRTVEVHKSRMMSKLRVDGVADLVRINLGIVAARER